MSKFTLTIFIDLFIFTTFVQVHFYLFFIFFTFYFWGVGVLWRDIRYLNKAIMSFF